MEVLPGNLYDYPKYYDLIFGSDWKAEYDFLLGCFARYCNGHTSRLFEPACGTGRLLFRLGKAGYEVSGLDLNPHAVRYCNQRLVRHGLSPTAWVGDMADFRLPKQADAAFNTINSFRHLLEESLAVSHLKMISRALRRGGIYVLGLHLTPTRGQPMDEESWSAQRGNLAVTSHLRTQRRDRRRRVEVCSMVYDVYTPTKHLQLRDEVQFRIYTWRDFQALLAEVPNLEIAGIHDFAYDLENRVRINAETEDVVFVLRRT